MDIELTNDGDIKIADNGSDMVLVDGTAAIAQDITIRLQTFLGEWFLDTRIGIPYFQKVLGQKPRLIALKGLFRKAILTTSGVISISDFTLNFTGATRTLDVSFTCQSDSGTFEYNKELIL